MQENVTEGNYYFFVNSDDNNAVNEYPNEGDNVSAPIKSVFIALPDLSPTAVSTVTTAYSAQTITVNYTVKNKGLGNLLNDNWSDRVYLSTDNIYDGNDILIGSDYNNNILLRNSSYTQNISAQIPPNISGKYYLIVVTAPTLESNITNDTFSVPITISLSPWPDLIVTTVTAPVNDTIGRYIAISYTTKDNGTSSIATHSWIDSIWLSPSNSLNDIHNIYLGTISQNASLNVGETFTSTGTYILSNNLNAGKYYIVVASDANNDIFENISDNNNRAISTAINIAPLPNIDLAITTGSLNAGTIMAGQAAQVTYTVKNITNVHTLTTGWTDVAYLSKDKIIDGNDISVGQWVIWNSLNGNDSLKQTQIINIPKDTKGTYYVLIQTDINNTQNDINRINNQIVLKTITVDSLVITQPVPVDLQPISLIAPTSVYAGQPIDISYTVRNNGPGSSFVSSWSDDVYLSFSTTSTSGYPESKFIHTGTLLPNATYKGNSQLFVPNNMSGNYLIAVNVNANGDQYELTGTDNNILTVPLIIKPQLPCDLYIDSIIIPTSSQIAGQNITLNYRVKNKGINPVMGYFKDAVYLSTDTIYSSDKDILLGTVDKTDTIFPGQFITRTLSAPLINVITGKYYVIVRTDVLNNLTESNENNNTTPSKNSVIIDVKSLQMGVAATDNLLNSIGLYYKIDITAAQANETMSLKLQGDVANNASNRIYLKYGHIPAANDFEFSSEIPFAANQEIIVPVLQKGTYYILIAGNDTVAAQKQTVTIMANLIPFSVTGVDANTGGNTGNVTVIIKGAKFETNSEVRLIKGSTIITAAKVWFVNSSLMYVTFPLAGAALGTYDVNVKRQRGDSVSLINGFQVVSGSPGGAEGANSFTCTIQNIGFENNLVEETFYPATTRRGRYVVITIAFANKGNVDIELPKRYMVSMGGAPINFTPDLSDNLQKLLLEYKELNGPQDVLRAGAAGAIKVYSKSIAPLNFIITE